MPGSKQTVTSHSKKVRTLVRGSGGGARRSARAAQRAVGAGRAAGAHPRRYRRQCAPRGAEPVAQSGGHRLSAVPAPFAGIARARTPATAATVSRDVIVRSFVGFIG